MNLYWSIYENLEAEVLRLADAIFFDDKQLKVYSVTIGNLIVRCAIEIESLAKELYCGLGGAPKIWVEEKQSERFPYFDTDCLDLLIKTWKIDQKKIQIVSSKMNFSQEKSVLTPLHKSNKAKNKGSLWKSAYQSFKHNRAQSIPKANVENLLGALGALYILNLYNRDDSFWYGVPIEGREEYQSHSKIFSPFVCDVSYHLPLSNDAELFKSQTDISLDESIYVKKYTDEAATTIRDLMYSYNLSLWLQTVTSNEFLRYKQEHPDAQPTIDFDFIEKIGLNSSKMIKNINVRNIPPEVYRQKEIVLNKSQQIYPERTWKDFLETPTANKMIDDRLVALYQQLSSEQD